MKINANEVVINDVVYVPKGPENKESEKLEGMKYVIVRSERAGVFAGYLCEHDLQSVIMKKARRLWMWYGAASLSQLAMDGVSRPNDCKFPCEVDNITINGVIEIIDCTEKARLSIKNVPIWSA